MIEVKCVLFWGGLVSKYKGFVGCKKRLRFISFWFCFGTLKKLHSFVHAIISEKRIFKKIIAFLETRVSIRKFEIGRHNLNKVWPAKPQYWWGNISILVLWIRWHLSVISKINIFIPFYFNFSFFCVSNHFMLNFLSYILGKLGNIQYGGQKQLRNRI